MIKLKLSPAQIDYMSEILLALEPRHERRISLKRNKLYVPADAELVDALEAAILSHYEYLRDEYRAVHSGGQLVLAMRSLDVSEDAINRKLASAKLASECYVDILVSRHTAFSSRDVFKAACQFYKPTIRSKANADTGILHAWMDRQGIEYSAH